MYCNGRLLVSLLFTYMSSPYQSTQQTRSLICRRHIPYHLPRIIFYLHVRTMQVPERRPVKFSKPTWTSRDMSLSSGDRGVRRCARNTKRKSKIATDQTKRYAK
jgi:hypothetical protein